MTAPPVGPDADFERFDELITEATSELRGGEVLTANYDGEASDFVRFNAGDVRQAGTVIQRTLALDLADGRRHATGTVRLTGDRTIDRARVGDLVDELRDQRRFVPDDPYLMVNTEVTSTVRHVGEVLPEPGAAVADVRRASAGLDLVGILALGSIDHGFASSLGQRNWSRAQTFNLDWSCYLRADKAAKNRYAGTAWDDAAFTAKLDWTRQQLAVLDRRPIDLEPGRYRTFLAPPAVQELTDMLAWGGFGLRAHRTKQTPLLRMVAEGATLSPQVRCVEDTAGGVGPAVQPQGFLRPDEVVLIDAGRYADHLVSPRSAAEFGVATNGAAEDESPESLRMAAGDLPTARVLDELGTGLHVGDLWYLNWSDRMACRTTGMTRFATFWVQDGEVTAPVNVLRFDDTAYRMLGECLVGLTDETEVLLDPSTYGQRSTASSRLPGALVEEMTFTL